LARRLTTILPDLTLPEAIDTTRIPRVAGRTGDRTAFVTTRLRHTSTTLPAQP
jgi:predicted ATPase with chaperone activity